MAGMSIRVSGVGPRLAVRGGRRVGARTVAAELGFIQAIQAQPAVVAAARVALAASHLPKEGEQVQAGR